MVARSLVCYKLGGIDTLVWWALVPYVMTHQLTFCINSMAHSKAWMSYRTYKNSAWPNTYFTAAVARRAVLLAPTPHVSKHAPDSIERDWPGRR